MWLCKYDLSKECDGKYNDCVDCVLDEIRAEIDMEKLEDSPNFCIKAHNVAVDRILQIINKYRTESEDEE